MKRSALNVLAFILCLCQGLAATAQTGNDVPLPAIIPPSPNAQALGRYGEIPVSHYTGKPEINVDLFSLTSGTLSFSINLQYDINGVKVSNAASQVGLGWILNSGGVITRSIVGLPDEQPSRGFTAYHANLPVGNGQNIQPMNDSLRNIYIGERDAEPDIYTYQFGNQGGRFANTGTGYTTQPLSNLKIVREQNGTLLSFRITDGQGIVYIFQDIELTQVLLGEKDYFSPTAWYLSKIINPNTGDSITLHYTDHLYTNTVPYAETFYELASIGTACQQQHANSRSIQDQAQTIYGKLLTTVKGRFWNLQFSYSGRLDAGDKKLDTITLVNTYKQQVQQSFAFQYDYFSGENGKLQLTGVTENGIAEKGRVYGFAYKEGGVPGVDSKAQDHWGYYNGKSNFATLIPSYVDARGNYVTGADREPNAAAMLSGVLTRITYPTGGYSQFEFEPHEYSRILRGSNTNPQYVLMQKSPTLVVQNGVTDQAVLEFYIPYEQAVAINYSISNCKNGPQAIPCNSPLDLPPSTKLLLQTSGGTTLATFVSNEPNKIKGGSVTKLLQAGTYKLVGEAFEFSDYGRLMVVYQDYDSTRPLKKWTGGGIRIKSIIHHDGISAANDIRKTYQYRDASDTLKSSGLLLNKPVYITTMTKWATGTSSPNGFPGCTDACGVRIHSSYSQGMLGVAGGSHVVYPFVTEITGEPGEQGYTTYEFTLPDFVLLLTPPFTRVSKSWKEGLLLKKTDYTAAGNKVREAKSNYLFDTSMQQPAVRCLKIAPRAICTADQVMTNGNYAYSELYVETYYQHFERLKWKVDSVFTYDAVAASRVLSTFQEQWFESSRHYNLTKQEAPDSKGGRTSMVLKYPGDFTGSAVYDAMVAHNQLEPLIEQSTYKGPTLLVQQKNNYAFWNNGAAILPLSVQKSLKSATPETEMHYEKYDARGNLLQYRGKDGVKICIVWGYGHSLPVAKIIGADHMAVLQKVDTAALQAITDEASLRAMLGPLRTLPHALISTYTYHPLVGMTSETDAHNRTTYYAYDALGRLYLVRDQQGNILKRFAYVYQQQ